MPHPQASTPPQQSWRWNLERTRLARLARGFFRPVSQHGSAQVLQAAGAGSQQAGLAGAQAGSQQSSRWNLLFTRLTRLAKIFFRPPAQGSQQASPQVEPQPPQVLPLETTAGAAGAAGALAAGGAGSAPASQAEVSITNAAFTLKTSIRELSARVPGQSRSDRESRPIALILPTSNSIWPPPVCPRPAGCRGRRSGLFLRLPLSPASIPSRLFGTFPPVPRPRMTQYNGHGPLDASADRPISISSVKRTTYAPN